MEDKHAQNIRQWLVELRSGNYKQGRDRLLQYDDKGNASYCCLGVAHRIFDGEWFDGPFPENGVKYSAPNIKGSFLTGHQITEYFGGYFDQDYCDYLAESNDSGYTFDEIADDIEGTLNAKLEGEDA